MFEKSLSSRDSIISSENHEGRGSVFKEYVDESRMVCSRNYGIVAEYGLLKYFLRPEPSFYKMRHAVMPEYAKACKHEQFLAWSWHSI